MTIEKSSVKNGVKMRDCTVRAQAKYKAKVIKPVQIALHRELDKDIIDRLDSVQSKQGYIKQLIRQDISNVK